MTRTLDGSTLLHLNNKGKVPVKAVKGMEGCVRLTLMTVEKLQRASLVC